MTLFSQLRLSLRAGTTSGVYPTVFHASSPASSPHTPGGWLAGNNQLNVTLL